LKTDSWYPKEKGDEKKQTGNIGNHLRNHPPRSAPPVSALAHSRGPGARQAEGAWARGGKGIAPHLLLALPLLRVYGLSSRRDLLGEVLRRARKLKICRIVVSHDDGTKLELSSARCQQGADYRTIRLNNLFASALRNSSGNRIVLLSAKTNPSVGVRRKKHRHPVKKPV